LLADLVPHWCDVTHHSQAYGIVLTLLLTEFIKRITGRPRPNFIELAGYDKATGEYGSSHAHVQDAFQAFPSGHASTSFAGLGYLSIYFFRLFFPTQFESRELAVVYHRNQGWKTVVSLLPIVLAAWIGLTRIVDYYHEFGRSQATSSRACIVFASLLTLSRPFVLSSRRPGRCAARLCCGTRLLRAARQLVRVVVATVQRGQWTWNGRVHSDSCFCPLTPVPLSFAPCFALRWWATLHSSSTAAALDEVQSMMDEPDGPEVDVVPASRETKQLPKATLTMAAMSTEAPPANRTPVGDEKV
jgi:hypothetical protein